MELESRSPLRFPESSLFGTPLANGLRAREKAKKPSLYPSRNQRFHSLFSHRVSGRAVLSVVFCPFTTGRPCRPSPPIQGAGAGNRAKIPCFAGSLGTDDS